MSKEGLYSMGYIGKYMMIFPGEAQARGASHTWNGRTPGRKW